MFQASPKLSSTAYSSVVKPIGPDVGVDGVDIGFGAGLDGGLV